MHPIPSMYQKPETGIHSFLIVIGTAIIITASGCAGTPQSHGTGISEYDANSWREVIKSSCLSYYDGCNTCTSTIEGGKAKCTNNTCTQYEKPECLDRPVQAKKLHFICDNNKSFKIFYGEYTIGNKKLPLNHNQAVFVDGTTRIAELMTQQPSKTGQTFTSGDLVLWTLIDKAVLTKGNDIHYTSCSATFRE